MFVIIEDYDCPMELRLPHPIIMYHPSGSAFSKKEISAAAKGVPLRLFTMRNGVRVVSKAVAVVGPDLSNMKKDMHHRHDNKPGRKKHEMHPADDAGDGESLQNKIMHCDDDLIVLKLEFILVRPVSPQDVFIFLP